MLRAQRAVPSGPPAFFFLRANALHRLGHFRPCPRPSAAAPAAGSCHRSPQALEPEGDRTRRTVQSIFRRNMPSDLIRGGCRFAARQTRSNKEKVSEAQTQPNRDSLRRTCPGCDRGRSGFTVSKFDRTKKIGPNRIPSIAGLKQRHPGNSASNRTGAPVAPFTFGRPMTSTAPTAGA